MHVHVLHHRTRSQSYFLADSLEADTVHDKALVRQWCAKELAKTRSSGRVSSMEEAATADGLLVDYHFDQLEYVRGVKLCRGTLFSEHGHIIRE